MTPSFWANKRVLITGHTGFKGGWLSLWLQQWGAKIIGYALEPPTQPNLFQLARVEQGMESVIGDVRDQAGLQAVFARFRPEIVFHLAAQPLVRDSYQAPVETYATNVMGTVHLLESVRQTGGVRVVVNITSDKCYENREWIWGYRETEPMGGYDPYSNSKGCAELVTSAYRNSFFNPMDFQRHGVALASARAGNVIGGGDWARDRLMPDIIKAFLASQPVAIRNPHAIRPWQHVLEPLGGYLKLAEKLWLQGPEYADGWNFGPSDDDAQPVCWIVERLTSLWGGQARWLLDEGDHLHEAHYLKLDCSKVRIRLDWRPRLSLEQALSRTVDWYKAYAAQADLRAVTVSQIGSYAT